MTAAPGRCGWHDLERVWNADEQRWMCPHYSQAAEVADAVRGIGPRWDEYADPDYDPTDAEQGPLERGWAQSRREVLANTAPDGRD